MNLSQLKTMTRAQAPGAKKARITTPLLELILNNGKDDVCLKTKCLPVTEDIEATAETFDYNLTSKLTRYLLPQKNPVYWNDGNQWRRLWTRTRDYMDKRFPFWRDDGSDDPRRYFIEGDTLTIHPKSDTTLVSGLRIHHFQRSPNMTASGQYPFGGTIEISRLKPLQDSIIDYARWKIEHILNKGVNKNAFSEQDYLNGLDRRVAELNRRPDLGASKNTKFQGDVIHADS